MCKWQRHAKLLFARLATCMSVQNLYFFAKIFHCACAKNHPHFMKVNRGAFKDGSHSRLDAKGDVGPASLLLFILSLMQVLLLYV